MRHGLQLEEVCKSFGSQKIVDKVSLTVPPGRFVCFLGPSGCGKTTLLRMIAGLEPHTSGRIAMDGLDLTGIPAHERNFAMVFQSLALFPFLTVEENISYSLRLRNVNTREARRTVRELLELIRLPDIGSRRIDQLSGGQRQRVAIARALAQKPALFLLDEPLSALDAKLRDHMRVELHALQRKLGVTTILVTHDQHEALTVADTIVVLANGVLQQVGAPMEVYRRPANRFVAGFIGRSNLIDAQVVDREHVRVWGRMMDVEGLPERLRGGDLVTLSIRPEDIRVLPLNAPATNVLPGLVSMARDLGDRVELRIDCEGREIVGATSPASWAALGCERIGVQIPASAASILTC